MTIGRRKAPALLFGGDIAVFALSLWLTLLIRYQALPSLLAFLEHLSPFLILFVLWTLVFFMSGLYEKRVFYKRDLPNTLLTAQVVNITLAALFFFFVPYFGITPKTNLAIYFGVSLGLLLLWRLRIVPRFSKRKIRQGALLVGNGDEVEELFREVNDNPRFPVIFRESVDPATVSPDRLTEILRSANAQILVVDTENDAVRPFLPELYESSFVRKEFQFMDFHQAYEDVFDRVPLSLLRHDWFLKNISHPAFGLYSILKRGIDIVGGLIMGIIVIVLAPLLFIAMKLEGPGPLFLVQERLGQYGSRVRAYKFRSLRFHDAASARWVSEGGNPVTRVGALLRLTSLDEFPQFINVLKGELSLIGPRNDIEGLGKRLAEAIPYYMVRYIVKPGITGWAQINQQYEQGNVSPQSVAETRTRLAYDFYYIKNRSLMLDLVIALKTIKRMLFRVSSY